MPIDPNDKEQVKAYNGWADRWPKNNGDFPLPNEAKLTNDQDEPKPFICDPKQKAAYEAVMNPFDPNNKDVIRDPDCPEGAVYYVPKNYGGTFPIEEEPTDDVQEMLARANALLTALPFSASRNEFELMKHERDRYKQLYGGMCAALGQFAINTSKPAQIVSQEPTLPEALAVLNERKHRGISTWGIRSARGKCVVVGDTNGFGIGLTEFEAIAVAEKYLREAK